MPSNIKAPRRARKKTPARAGQASPAALRGIPAVSRLLADPALGPLAARLGGLLVTTLVRERLQFLRDAARAGGLDRAAVSAAVDPRAIAAAIGEAARALIELRPQPVVNATGVVVHTNLGRAILAPSAAEALARTACGYVDLEYDLAAGRRGSRLDALAPLVARLFPGQACTVVNNNAAAVLLALRALARDREVVVSRGELVEIGGSFRVPDILSVSGARLVEVGTTNRTRLSDYSRAISKQSGAILKVHTSNFKIVGFTEEVSVAELAALARRAGIPLIVDWGSGDLVDLGPLGITDDWPVTRVLADGADVVTFSGDKLLGGPQSGFAVGGPEWIERLRRDPLQRVCRLDRLRLAALRQTLVSYVLGRAFEEVPTLRMLALEPAEIERRALRIIAELAQRLGRDDLLRVVDGISRTGGGSSPTGERPTRLIRASWPGRDSSALERGLRTGVPPVIGRIQDGALLLDLRTVLPEQDDLLLTRMEEVLRSAGLSDARRREAQPRRVKR